MARPRSPRRYRVCLTAPGIRECTGYLSRGEAEAAARKLREVNRHYAARGVVGARQARVEVIGPKGRPSKRKSSHV